MSDFPTFRGIEKNGVYYPCINDTHQEYTGVDARTDSNGDIKTDIHAANTFYLHAYVPNNVNSYVVIPFVYESGGGMNWAFRIINSTTNEPVKSTSLTKFHVVYHEFADLAM